MATISYTPVLFHSETDMEEALTKVCRSQEIISCPVDELRLEELANAPILVDSLKKQHGFEAEEEDILACMPNELLITFPYYGNQVKFPVYQTAIKSLRDRAKLYGKSTEFKPMILNEGFPFYKEPANLLLQDHVLLAAHSSQYQFLKQDELFRLLMSGLKFHMGGYSFCWGIYSRELTAAYFLFPQKQNSLKAYNLETCVPGVLFTTNDVAQCGANLQATLTREQAMNGTHTRITCHLGTQLSTTHDKKHDVSDFGQKLDSVFSILQDGTKKLEKLGKIKLEYPSQCFVNVVKELKLPKKEAKSALEDFQIQMSSSTTAADLYWALWNIPEYLKGRGQGYAQILSVEENISRALSLQWNRYDVDYAL